MAEEKKLERKVGDEFFSGFYGKSYKVCTSKRASDCPECAFHGNNLNTCKGLYEETGECVGRKRSDGQNVIFKEVCKR